MKKQTGKSKGLPGEIAIRCAYDEMVEVGKLKPHPRNSNQHPDKQITMLAQLIRYHGWRRPITVSSRSKFIVRGHGERLAAIKLGVTHVPVDYQEYASEKDEISDLMADNQIASLSDLDFAVTADNLALLDDGDFPLAMTGFDPAEIERMLTWSPESDRDEKQPVPEPPGAPRAKLGRIYHLGPHKIMCGDSTNRGNILKLMAGEQAQMVFTDPPYGVAYKAESGKGMIQGDGLTGDALAAMLTKAFKAACEATKDEAAFYIWHASSTRDEFSYAMKAAGLTELQYLIWAKNSIGLGYSHYRWMHEPCFYASKEGKTPAFYGDQTDSTVWTIQHTDDGQTCAVIGTGILVSDGNGGQLFITQKPPRAKKVRRLRLGDGRKLALTQDDSRSTIWQISRDPSTAYRHPTQKPVELAVRALGNSSQPGDIVLDMFLGSGSTLLAAERLSRRCFGMELDPGYVDVCIERWCNYTGNSKELIYG